MVWLIVRALVTVILVALGLWLAFHEGRRKAERAIGLVVVTVALLQSLDAILSLGDRVLSYLEATRSRELHDVVMSADAHAIDAYNRFGQPLWRRIFSGIVREVILEDIQEGGSPEVIIGIGGDDDDTGKIFVLSDSGDLVWKFDANTRYPYSGGSSGRMTIEDLALLSDRSRGDERVVALARDVRWFPSRLVLLTSSGHLASEYWNPGFMKRVAVARSHDDKERLIVWARNNDLRQTSIGNGSDYNFEAVFALDANHISGEAPPYFGPDDRGSHIWYIVVLPQGESVARLELVERGEQSETFVGIWLDCGWIFYVDLDGRLRGRGRADNARCDPDKTKLLTVD